MSLFYDAIESNLVPHCVLIQSGDQYLDKFYLLFDKHTYKKSLSQFWRPSRVEKGYMLVDMMRLDIRRFRELKSKGLYNRKQKDGIVIYEPVQEDVRIKR